MEKFYIVTNEKFLQEMKRDKENENQRRDFIKEFFKENGIAGNGYHFSGSGFCNVPFKENEKEYISLHVEDNTENREKFGKEFKNSRVQGLKAFKKKSKILKKFQDECVKQKIVINYHTLRPGDYFEELGLGGYSTQLFKEGENVYLKMRTEKYESITPRYEGFLEVKGSQYFQALERLQG